MSVSGVQENQRESILNFTREQCLNLENSIATEWLETNGMGGFASGTVANCQNRKYHSLLTLPLEGKPSKFSLLSKLEAAVIVNKKEFLLSTNKFPGVFYPTGHQYIDNFELGLFPSLAWRIGDIVLRRSVLMPRGRSVTLMRFEVLEAPKPFTLRLRPLISYRDFHYLQHENLGIRVKMFRLDNRLHKMEPYDGMPPLYLSTSSAVEFFPGPCWYKSFEYLKERSRGFEYQEDLFCPGLFEKKLKKGDSFYLAVGIEQSLSSLAPIWRKEETRRAKLFASYSKSPFPLNRLKFKAENFLLEYPNGESSITAGYPWFGEWGRDAMIALPGLTLYTGRKKAALAILTTYAKYSKNGLLPNTLDADRAYLSYNSLDASLWYFWAVQQYANLTGNFSSLKKNILPCLSGILEAFLDGRHPWARINQDGLVEAGNKDTQLTWMDAKVHGRPITSRHGMAVEINALWYNALCFYLEVEKKLGLVSTGFKDAKEKAERSFTKVFWNKEEEYLADVVNEEGPDFSVRPNQIFAVSLDYSPLNKDQQVSVLKKVDDELFTPFGLRSLGPQNPAYIGEYKGNEVARDGAYHQGTVWGWLAGPFVEASLKMASNKKQTAADLRNKFKPLFQEHPLAYGLDSISEIFNGNPPYKPRGCFAQAWSVAEVIRAWELIRKVEE